MKMDYVLNARRRDISEETVHKDKKKAPVASFSPRKMKGKDTHTHIKALVALMDEDEKEALFKAAEEEGF